jgi:hypothetical protein
MKKKTIKTNKVWISEEFYIDNSRKWVAYYCKLPNGNIIRFSEFPKSKLPFIFYNPPQKPHLDDS